MNKEYLPSKIFMIRVAAIFIIVVTVFGISKIYSYFKNRPSGSKVVKLLFKDVVQKDSNTNGVPDWEETLWGLDPTKDGPSNKEFINAKKKTLSNNGILDTQKENGAGLSQNDQLSREFFSIIMSLQQSGTLNEESINLISDTIGEKVAAAPIADIYSRNMLIIKPISDEASILYYNEFNKLVDKYANRNIGDELVFISEGLKNNDATAMKSTQSVAEAYREFGKDLMKIPAPASIADKHLSLANNYEKTGQAIDGFAQILEYPIAGMKSIINYKNYSDGIVSDLSYITDNL